MKKETLIKRLVCLMDKHRVLDKKVSDDYKNHVDDVIVQKEKFEKVALKKEIDRLQRQLGMI
jgi:hypothetical protein